MTACRKFLARFGRILPLLLLLLKGGAGLSLRVPRGGLREILVHFARRLFQVDFSFGDCIEIFASTKFSQ